MRWAADFASRHLHGACACARFRRRAKVSFRPKMSVFDEITLLLRSYQITPRHINETDVYAFRKLRFHDMVTGDIEIISRRAVASSIISGVPERCAAMHRSHSAAVELRLAIYLYFIGKDAGRCHRQHYRRAPAIAGIITTAKAVVKQAAYGNLGYFHIGSGDTIYRAHDAASRRPRLARGSPLFSNKELSRRNSITMTSLSF